MSERNLVICQLAGTSAKTFKFFVAEILAHNIVHTYFGNMVVGYLKVQPENVCRFVGINLIKLMTLKEGLNQETVFGFWYKQN